MTRLRDALLAPTHLDLTAIDSRDTPGLPEGADKDDAQDALLECGDRLSELQEILFANGRAGVTRRSVLVVLQGMDTAGKGGVMRKVAGLLDPQGLAITAFGRPTDEELRHDFLWRIEKRLPPPGRIGVFDRSHYEDVLVPRVRGDLDAEELERRFTAITAFEDAYVRGGGVLMKCFLHIDPADQAERLRSRLDDPTKHWKYDPGDLADRARWAEFRAANEEAIERTSKATTPWFVVPSGRKWYRNWAVATLLRETLQGLDLDWPAADFDVEAEKARLESMT